MDNIKLIQATPTSIVRNSLDKAINFSPLVLPLVAIILVSIPCFCLCLCYARCWTRNKIPQTPKTPKQIA